MGKNHNTKNAKSDQIETNHGCGEISTTSLAGVFGIEYDGGDPLSQSGGFHSESEPYYTGCNY